MTKLALVGSDLDAFGHPSQCVEPFPGSVVGDCSVSVNGTPIAVEVDASMEFDIHSHDYTDSCINNSAHSLQPDKLSQSVSVNGNPVYLELDDAGTDPVSSDSIDFVNSGGNESVTTKWI